MSSCVFRDFLGETIEIRLLLISLCGCFSWSLLLPGHVAASLRVPYCMDL
jgi:hypothetical protein